MACFFVCVACRCFQNRSVLFAAQRVLLPVLFHFLLGGEDTDIVSKPSRRIGVIPFNRACAIW